MDAKTICSRFDRLNGERLTLLSLFQEIAQSASPRKAQIMRQTTPGSEVDEMNMYDPTLGQASLVEAAGMMSNITPQTDRWCALAAPEWLKTQRGENVGASWYEQVSAITIQLLADSNFYTEIHEAYLNRNDFGTCCVWAAEGRRRPLNFRSCGVKEFVFAEDDEQYVDTVFREFEMTARQALQQFGEAALPPEIAPIAKDPIRCDQKFTFIHCVYPRADMERTPGARDGKNKPIASIYVSKTGERIVSESGFDEMPYAVSRYLRRDDSIWGYGPAEFSLPTVRQINLLEQNLDILSEVAANPRLLVPSSLSGNVQLQAGGVTIFDDGRPDLLPREWMTQGRYDIGKDRIEEKREFIRKAFHNDLFQMFSGLEREITAYQAMQMVNEKLDSFGPTFTLLTTELLTPLLQRVYGILQRRGYFPPPPEEIIVRTPGGIAIPVPAITYNSKFALAVRAAQNRSFTELQQLLQPLVTVDQTVLDNFDLDKAARGVARNTGYPDDWIRHEDEVKEIRAGRAKQQAQQEAIMAGQGIAKAAADASKASPEVNNRLASMMGEN